MTVEAGPLWLQLLFWASLLWVLYVYLGYPLLLLLLAPFGRPPRRDPAHRPFVSVLVAAHQEADGIEATLRNKLAQRWPQDRLEILVVSDASTDGTDDVVRRVAADSAVPVRLVRQEPRAGKTAGLERLVPLARGELLLFSDANSEWAPDAVARLAENFADPTVGYVTGKMVYTRPDGSLLGDGCSAYMRYENFLRRLESRFGSVVGVDGGIDAMRRSLYASLRPDQLPDFVQPLKVVEQGARVVYDERAVLREPALAEARGEFAMRERVTLRALWALKDMATLADPRRRPRFAFQLWSHKILRYLAFLPLLVLLPTSALLAPSSTFAAVVLLGQLLCWGVALVVHRTPALAARSALFALPYYFALLNLSCATAALAFLRGERRVTWKPREG